jgi:hypothetical protein
MKNLILLAVLVLSACGSKNTKIPLAVYTPEFIVKEAGPTYHGAMEVSPFLWNGKLLYMISRRDTHMIQIMDGKTEIALAPSPIEYGSALVVGDRLIVTGSNGDRILMQESRDLVNWSEPRVILPFSPGRALFNTSFIELPDGSFMMVYETCEKATLCFNARFVVFDKDFNNPRDLGILSQDKYFACPTIRLVDGWFYVFYLRDVGHWATYVTRTKDFVNWEFSEQVVLSAYGTDEDINNSDMDFAEYNGELVINYVNGDQMTWGYMKTARYAGTLAQFVNEFFK